MSGPYAPHRWRFFRAGGLDQVRIETGDDIANIDTLDQKLWVALACPVKGLELDEKTLGILDIDKDGRVRAPEVIAAVRFCRDNLTSLDGLLTESDLLPLASINVASPTGAAILASARRVLTALGKGSAHEVSLSDVSDTAAILAGTRYNGDGIILPDSTDDAALKQVIADAIATVANDVDRRGRPGISQARLDEFFEQLAAFDAWTKKGEDAPADLFPLGAATAEAAAALAVVKPKIDDYFTRVRLAAFDPRAGTALEGAPSEYAAFVGRALSYASPEVAALPLSPLDGGGGLLLTGRINPAWNVALDALSTKVIAPLLGGPRTILTEAEWAIVQGRLAAHIAWAASKPATKADALGITRVREILASSARQGLAEVVTLDKSFAVEFDNISNLEKLVRLHRDLYKLLNNFVAFADFYGPFRPATFQAGTLYLDSRACDLCVRVNDAGRHAALAGLSKCYLAYCDCVRPNGEKMQIAAVFSAGDSDYLMVGRNGLFYDRQGRDWDATITRVVDNPISLREAFFSPYKKVVRFLEEQVAKRAAAADTAATGNLTSAADAGKPPAPPKQGGFDLGSIALIGVAISGAAAVIGGLLQAFFGLGIFMPLGLVGLVIAVSGPSMLIAALKLRQRNIGPILDANGWAINARVKVNIPFGGSLTKLPVFPPGSQRSVVDTYVPVRNPWVPVGWTVASLIVLALVSLLAYHQGWWPYSVEARLGFLGVPKHLETAKATATVSVDEARKVLTSAQEQQAAAKKTYDELVAAAVPDDPKIVRAKGRLDRADAKLGRAEDKLDRYEARLETATEALDVAIDADEARKEAAEAVRAARAAEAEEAARLAEAKRVEATKEADAKAAEEAKAAEAAAALEAAKAAEGAPQGASTPGAAPAPGAPAPATPAPPAVP